MSTLDQLFRVQGRELQSILEQLSTPDQPTADIKSQLRKKWGELKTLPPSKGSKLKALKQKRGYDLEKLILALCALEHLQPEAPFRPKGEQLDGRFVLDGRALLLETKWQQDESSASDIFAFQGKLRGKLAGTLGVFVSTGGFAEAARAVAWGKEINVLFFDSEDIELALEPKYHLAEITRTKLRRAAQRGEVYYSYRKHLDLMTA
jgi:Restriction endonuclease